MRRESASDKTAATDARRVIALPSGVLDQQVCGSNFRHGFVILFRRDQPKGNVLRFKDLQPLLFYF